MDVARALGTHPESPAAEMTRPSPALQEVKGQPSETAQPPWQVRALLALPHSDSGSDMGEHFSDAHRDGCSGMPPANNQACADLQLVQSVERASGGILATAAVAAETS